MTDDRLIDRAFGDGSAHASGTVLADVADVTPAAPHNTANALAAAALARSVGVAPAAVRDGLRTFVPEPHRIALVARVDGVDYVDDSKATNTHAAATSLAAYPSVVWVAGGLAKGGEFDDLVRRHGHRIRAAVLLGTDRAAIAEALARHAPTIPVVEVDGPETSGMSLMGRVVAAAAALATPGRHGAAGARVRVVGPVRRLHGSRTCLRRRRGSAARSECRCRLA